MQECSVEHVRCEHVHKFVRNIFDMFGSKDEDEIVHELDFPSFTFFR